ncbi:hypothetical protein [Aeromonas sp. R2-1]|uniref:hypothetical protein n=1 Tax=Aeromonas sp. R2-1 TaxID=3138459 RepID=UPI0034A54AA2
MKSFFVAIVLLLMGKNSTLAKYDVENHAILTTDLEEWCSGEADEQAFCHGFLTGIYENSTCMNPPRKTYNFQDLKETFLGWTKFKGDKGYAFASEGAAMALYEKYGCKSYLQKTLVGLKN